MGKCQSSHYPHKYSNPELVNLNIGERAQSPSGCTPCIGGNQWGSGEDRCRHKGFSWPNNGEYEWGGLGEHDCNYCTADEGCDCHGGGGIAGCKCTVKRAAFNGNLGACCLLGGTRQLTSVKLNYPMDWKYFKGDYYTCNSKIFNPYQQDSVVNCAAEVLKVCSDQDQATWDQWDAKKKGACVDWVNEAGTAHYSEAAAVLQGSLQTFANKYKTADQPTDVHAQAYLGNILAQCAKYPAACDAQMKQLCSAMTRNDVLNAYDGLINNQNNWNIVAACGCHLPDDQYTEYGKFGIDEKYYDSCDPLCKLNPAIPKATCDGEGKNCQPWPCEQTICIIDNVTVDVMNSDIKGGINFNITCGGCDKKAGGCLCVFSDITVFSEASRVGSIDFNMHCGGQCAVADPNRPGAYTKVNCISGKPSNGGNGPVNVDKIWKWIVDHKKEVLIGSAVILVIIVLVMVIYMATRTKSAVDMTRVGYGQPQTIGQYFDEY